MAKNAEAAEPEAGGLDWHKSSWASGEGVYVLVQEDTFVVLNAGAGKRFVYAE